MTTNGIPDGVVVEVTPSFNKPVPGVTKNLNGVSKAPLSSGGSVKWKSPEAAVQPGGDGGEAGGGGREGARFLSKGREGELRGLSSPSSQNGRPRSVLAHLSPLPPTPPRTPKSVSSLPARPHDCDAASLSLPALCLLSACSLSHSACTPFALSSYLFHPNSHFPLFFPTPSFSHAPHICESTAFSVHFVPPIQMLLFDLTAL
eukprot:1976205-Rhodomonas_salina.1